MVITLHRTLYPIGYNHLYEYNHSMTCIIYTTLILKHRSLTINKVCYQGNHLSNSCIHSYIHMDLILNREIFNRFQDHIPLSSRMLKIVMHEFFINHNAMLYNLLYDDDCFTIQEKATNQCYIRHQYMVYHTFEEYLNTTDKTSF